MKDMFSYHRRRSEQIIRSGSLPLRPVSVLEGKCVRARACAGGTMHARACFCARTGLWSGSK